MDRGLPGEENGKKGYMLPCVIAYIRVCVCARTCVCAHVCMYVRVCVYVRARVCVCVCVCHIRLNIQVNVVQSITFRNYLTEDVHCSIIAMTFLTMCNTLLNITID